MNKYYIGYSLPEDVREKIRELHMHVMGNCELVDIGQLHITACHLGPYPCDEAAKVFHGMQRRNLPILCVLDTYARFGNHLVITLQPNYDLSRIHAELNVLAGKPILDQGGLPYNPHITVSHGKNGYIRTACPTATFTLNSITLFEKPPGGVYDAYMVRMFR